MLTESPDQALLDALNAIALEEAELFKVIEDVNLGHELGMCSYMNSWFAQNKLTEAAPHKAKAILTRLQALISIIDSDEIKPWIVTDGTSAIGSMRRALVSAAADHPLSIINGRIAFEKESFVRRLLELVKPEGSCS